MMKKFLQNRVAESHYALLTTAIYTFIVWYLGGLVGQRLYMQLGIFAVCTYLMMELNNANALIRIYSRMVSCSFMVLSALSLYAIVPLGVSLVMLCFITFLLTLFNIYQDKHASGWAFYAFACLGIASTIFPQIVFFVPFMWMFMGFLLMALGPRTFWASVVGFVVPYWFILPYCLLTGSMDFFVNLFRQLIDFQPLFRYDNIQLHQLLSFAITTLLAAIGTVHFLRNSFRDKIRTRMFFNIFIYLSLLVVIFIVLQPQHFNILISMLIVVTSPLIGHFVALTRTRTTNVTFCLLILIVVAATLFNLLVTTGLLDVGSWMFNQPINTQHPSLITHAC